MRKKNNTEKIMYKAALKKIKELNPEKLYDEYSITLSDGCIGSYDFFVECNGKKIGFELMCRPTKGKLKEKLRYLDFVDKYVFVLPVGSLELYKRHSVKCFEPLTRPKFFPKEFASKKLFVWLCSIDEKRIVEHARFSRVFNVEK